MSSLLQAGEEAPDFELPNILGGSIRLSNYRGRPVVLAFLRGFL
jgi:peroxiredoxin